MAPFLVLLVSLVFLISYAAGDDPDEFKNPPDASTNVKSASKNPVYNAGDQVEFSWSTSADEVELVIEQQLLEGSDTDDGTPIGSKLGDSSYNWTVTTNGSDSGPDYDLMKGNQFMLWLHDSHSNKVLTGSVSFNITNSTVDAQGRKKKVSSSSSSSASSTSSTQSSSSTTSSATTSATATPTSTNSPPPKQMGTGTKAGIGIGIGMGAFAAIGSVVFIMYRLMNKSRQQHGVDSNPAAWARGEQAVNIPMSANTTTHAANAPLLAP